jgi:RNA polymerase sigma-70 factor (ECF subfamily)
MNAPDGDSDDLVEQASGGDANARQLLLVRYRDRLCKMVAFHLDPHVAARVDASDVVQEALADAARKLDDYLRQRPLPFYPWLRRLAWERLVKLHRRHLQATKRSAYREEPGVLNLPDDSALELAGRLLDVGSAPSARLLREELRVRVRAALDRLAAADREVLVLRYLEQLTVDEIAAVLGITEAAVKKRNVRALERLRGLLRPDLEEEQR